MAYFLGLDLAQSADYSSLAVVEATGKRRVLRQMDRTRGRSYTKVVDDVVEFCGRPDMAGATLAVDATGVGVAVVEMLQERLPGGYTSSDATALESLGVKAVPRQTRLIPIAITSGQDPNPDGRGGLRVPKKDLVSPVLVQLEQGLLTLNREDKLCDELLKELHAFSIKITKARNETFEAAGAGHDDLVLAVALACWAADRLQPADYTGPLLCTDGPPDEPKKPETQLDTLADLGYFGGGMEEREDAKRFSDW